MTRNLDNQQSRFNTYQKVGLASVFAVYFLILVGGIVRSTGAGMGCPDWPKCFDMWIPPTSVSELPSDYEEKLTEKRIAKNDRLQKVLKQLNLTGLYYSSQSHNINESIQYNVSKAWIEYLNRVVGVIIGFLVLTTTLLSFKYIRAKKRIFVGSVMVLVLTLFQGWLGSLVVSTNLLPGMISLHMVLALIIVCLLIYTVFTSLAIDGDFLVKSETPSLINIFLVVCLVTSFVQLLYGIQVRESVDTSSFERNVFRLNSLEFLGTSYLIHRTFSIIVIGVHVVLFFLLRYKGLLGSVKKEVFMLFSLIGIEIVIGVIMGYFSIPRFIQPFHLLFATLIIGLEFFIIMKLNPHRFFGKFVSPKIIN